jgi:hypothetical protein
MAEIAVGKACRPRLSLIPTTPLLVSTLLVMLTSLWAEQLPNSIRARPRVFPAPLVRTGGECVGGNYFRV